MGVHANTHTHTHTHTCAHTYHYTHMYIHMHTHMHTHTYTLTYSTHTHSPRAGGVLPRDHRKTLPVSSLNSLAGDTPQNTRTQSPLYMETWSIPRTILQLTDIHFLQASLYASNLLILWISSTKGHPPGNMVPGTQSRAATSVLLVQVAIQVFPRPLPRLVLGWVALRPLPQPAGSTHEHQQ